jgi:hypothetical protein
LRFDASWVIWLLVHTTALVEVLLVDWSDEVVGKHQDRSVWGWVREYLRVEADKAAGGKSGLTLL